MIRDETVKVKQKQNRMKSWNHILNNCQTDETMEEYIELNLIAIEMEVYVELIVFVLQVLRLQLQLRKDSKCMYIKK